MERRMKQLANVGARVAQRYVKNRVLFIGGLAMPGNEKNKKWFIVVAIALVCFAFADAVRAGTGWMERQKLLAPDGNASDSFGNSVSVSGDYAIVGANNDDGKGSAYIFLRSGTSWSQQQKFTASDVAPNDSFGYSVSISGDSAIVGAYCDDTYKGSAYIFLRSGTNWGQQAKLTASDGAANDQFGYSIAISSELVIVGAYGDDDKGSESGSAYIFKFCPRADLNDDCKVDFADYAIFADWWLYGTD